MPVAPPGAPARAGGPHALLLLLALAAILRTLAALLPGFHHPDAIYQYLEPAHRLLTGDGLTTWEWRVGMRSWLLPTLLAGPMAIGGVLAPAGDLDLLLPRLAVGAASLAIVWAAWALGRRVDPRTGILAAFVAAIWFELVDFGVQTLAEPVATAAFLPAAALVASDRPTRRALAAAGALLALATLLRPHYAPACLALAFAARWRDLRRALPPLLLGALAVALASAAIDVANHAVPFRWAIENVRQNIVEHRADRYGIAPRFAFVAWYMTMWRWWAIPLLVGLRAGWRHAPALTIAALLDLALHSLIGHKEYRFVYLTTCALVIVAAIGWGALLSVAAARLSASRRRWATLAVFAGWTAASLTLATDATMAALRREGRAGSILFAAIRHDPAACGAAVVEDATFADVPGRAGLRADIALAIFAAHDPAYGAAGMRGALARWAPTANRIVTTPRLAAILPPGYAPRTCEPWETGRLCLFARAGTCTAAAASPFAANTALRRLNF